MRRLRAFLVLLFLAWPLAAQDAPAKPDPAAARPVTTKYFGVEVTDPYRYMEHLSDPVVTSWIDRQSRHARSLLASVPGRARILAELAAMEKSAPARIGRVKVMPGGRYFYLKRPPGQNFYSLYGRDGLSGREVRLLDPDPGRPAGAVDSRIVSFSPSFDSRYVACGISSVATGDSTLRVLDAETGKLVGNVITGAASRAAAWLPGGNSFLYVRREKGSRQSSGVYLHRLGTAPAGDVAVFRTKAAPGMKASAGDIASVETAPGSGYVVVAWKDAVDGSLILYAAPLAQMRKGTLTWKRIGNDDVTILDYGMRGNDLFLLVNGLDGPVIAGVSLDRPGVNRWDMMLQLPPQESVTGLAAAADAVYLSVLHDGAESLVRLPYNSTEEILRAELPFRAGVTLYNEDPRVTGALVKLSSWTGPPAIYRYQPKTDKVVRTGLWPSGAYGAPGDIVSTDATAVGSNGVLVPLTIVYRKGAHRDGSHPTLLVGYGAFGYTRIPEFQPGWLVWLKRGGVLAFAHVSSPTRFQDFLTCAHYLIDQGYTVPGRLAAIGGGAGGILVGRAMTADPGMFRAVVIDSGWLDLLGSGDWPVHLLDGWNLASAKTLKGFRKLELLSAYEHVAGKVDYPAVLLRTGMGSKVPAWQSAKMAARLDADSASGLPVLLSVQAGQGETSASKKRALFADQISFLLWQLGEPGFQPAQPETSAAATN